MANDKKRPIEERIAALMGNSAFVDLRDGVGGTNPMRIRHQDIAAALGFVARKHGRIAPLVLETHYGSTLLHEKPLARAWEDRETVKGQPREATVLLRFAGALAIRQLAGAKHCSTQYAEYAYLIFSRREALQKRVNDAAAWLEEIRDAGLQEFKRALRDVIEERKKEKAEAA